LNKKKRNAKPEYWVPDSETYNQILKLKKYVDFVAGLEHSTAEDKTKAEEIKLLIENIDKPECFLKSWWVGLDIFDYNIQGGRGSGIYWRKWWVSFELDSLVIEAESYHSDDPGYCVDYYHYNGGIFFEKDIKGERIYLDNDLDDFINDAMNYKSYMTEALNEIEVDIDVWNKVKHQTESESQDIVKYSVKINLGNSQIDERD
jgi:hypothetical protein